MKSLSLLALFLLPLTAFAQSDPGDKHPIDREMEAAAKKDPTARGRNRVYSSALDKWDAELNRHYKALVKNLESSAATKLRESQRAWVIWRDKEIASLDAFYGKMEGSLWGPDYNFAVMDLTRQRALRLKTLTEHLEERGK